MRFRLRVSPAPTVLAALIALGTLGTRPADAALGVGVPAPLEPVRFPAVRNQDQVAASDNGAVTLFVWRDTRHGNGDVFAARVAHDGTVLDPNGIEIAAGTGEQGEPAVSWSGSNWLVAWSDAVGGASSVRATRIASDGSAIDPAPIDLATGGPALASHPALAWNGEVHIVVWQEATSGPAVQKVRATSVSEDGIVLAAAIDATAGTTDQAPAAAALGTDALVVFKSSRSGSVNVYATRLKATLAVPTPARLDVADIALAPLAVRQDRPAVAASGAGWLAAWEDARNVNSGTDIYGTRVSAAGAVQDANGIAIGTANGKDEAPALTHTGSQWLVAWSNAGNEELRAIANNGNPAGGSIAVGAAAPVASAAFGGAPATPLLAWSAPGEGGTSDLLARSVAANLSLGTPFPIATQTPNQTLPALAFGSNHWFIAWLDDRFGASERQIRGGLTDSAKFEAPNPATLDFVIPRLGLDQDHPVMVFDGTNFNLFWDESRGGRRILQGARFTPGGALIDTFTVSGGAWNQYEPSACSRDGFVFVAWTDTRGGPTERDVYVATLRDGEIKFGPRGAAVDVGVREEAPKIGALQDYAVLVAYEALRPDQDRGIESIILFTPEIANAFNFNTVVAQQNGLTYNNPGIASNGEDLLVTYQEIDDNDGPALHTPTSRWFRGDNQFYYCCPSPLGVGSYAPANPIVASAGYDFVTLWGTLAGGGPDLIARAVDPTGGGTDGPIRVTNDPIVDGPGAAAQGQGDRVGFAFTRALADGEWSGLQLYGGDARDTLDGKVVINEFLANPPSGVAEFYELFNKSGRNFLLNGWQLVIDNDSTTVDDCPSDAPGGGGLDSAPGGIGERVLGSFCSDLPDGDFEVDSLFIGHTPGAEGHLPNRGGRLRLFSPGGVLVDEIAYGYIGGAPVSAAIPVAIAPGSAMAPPRDQNQVSSARPGYIVSAIGDSVPVSTVRLPNGADSGNDANDFSLSTNNTTNAANQGAAPAVGTTLFAVRIAWNPTVGTDAVELFNPSTTQTYDFTGWYISNNNALERLGVPNNVFGIMKPGDRRVLRRGEPGSFTFDLDAISTLSLLDPNLTNMEQIGWARADNITPDSCVTRVPESGGFHDGWDWLSSGGNLVYTTGAVRYAPCTIDAPAIEVTPMTGTLDFSGAWPNPARAGQTPVLVFTVPGSVDGAAVHARLDLYNVAGRRVASVLDGAVTPGEHRLALPRRDERSRTLAAGVYYAELEVGGRRVRKSVVLLD